MIKQGNFLKTKKGHVVLIQEVGTTEATVIDATGTPFTKGIKNLKKNYSLASLTDEEMNDFLNKINKKEVALDMATEETKNLENPTTEEVAEVQAAEIQEEVKAEEAQEQVDPLKEAVKEAMADIKTEGSPKSEEKVQEAKPKKVNIMEPLYNKLIATVEADPRFEGATVNLKDEYCTMKKGKNFAEVILQRKNIKLNVNPTDYSFTDLNLVKLPEKYGWAQSIQLTFDSEAELDKVVEILLASSNYVKPSKAKKVEAEVATEKLQGEPLSQEEVDKITEEIKERTSDAVFEEINE